MSLKQDLANYVRVSYPNYVAQTAIEDFARLNHKSASNATRRARELVRSGMFVKDPDSRYARYKFNAEEYNLNLNGMKKGKSTYKVEGQQPFVIWQKN